MDRLLMLMQLELNGLADESGYAKSIRERLIANDGRPAVERRAVTDHDGPLAALRACQETAPREDEKSALRSVSVGERQTRTHRHVVSQWRSRTHVSPVNWRTGAA
jgi:hypothetical protein